MQITMNEKPITIKATFDPDLTKQVARTYKKHQDILTGETIPKGATCYKLGVRIGRKLYAGYVSTETYQKLTQQ